MRESDLIAPLGLATLFAALKGRQNKMDSQTAYANEVERLNELALQSQEETEDISPEPEEQKLTSSIFYLRWAAIYLIQQSFQLLCQVVCWVKV